jgi:hypothetical protein
MAITDSRFSASRCGTNDPDKWVQERMRTTKNDDVINLTESQSLTDIRIHLRPGPWFPLERRRKQELLSPPEVHSISDRNHASP